jgi:hypothetical protein
MPPCGADPHTSSLGMRRGLDSCAGEARLEMTRFKPLLGSKVSHRPRTRSTFAGVRALTWSIHNGVGPFHDIHMGGRHIHHLVWDILLLLIVGYGWMIDAGGQAKSLRLAGRRLLCILYGAAAALTLDEFALWLNLRDVYWAR